MSNVEFINVGNLLTNLNLNLKEAKKEGEGKHAEKLKIKHNT